MGLFGQKCNKSHLKFIFHGIFKNLLGTLIQIHRNASDYMQRTWHVLTWRLSFQASEAKDDTNKISQYVPLDEDEHKEIDRTHNLNSARTFFYQGEAECDSNMKVFIDCIDAVKGKSLTKKTETRNIMYK